MNKLQERIKDEVRDLLIGLTVYCGTDSDVVYKILWSNENPVATVVFPRSSLKFSIYANDEGLSVNGFLIDRIPYDYDRESHEQFMSTFSLDERKEFKAVLENSLYYSKLEGWDCWDDEVEWIHSTWCVD